jgi:Spy/CpxP family protein refolding chaperone
MQVRTLLIVVGFLLAPVSALGGEIKVPVPAFHEGFTQAWDEVSRHLEDMGSRLSEHFRRAEVREERPLITFMLRHRDKLGLSADQVQGLERLRDSFQREVIRSEADLRIADMDLASLLSADPIDLQKVEAKVREIERLKSDLRLARIRAIEKGKALLNAEQRAKLNNLMAGPRYSRLEDKD